MKTKAAEILEQAIKRNADKKAARALTPFRRELLTAVSELGEHAYGHMIAQFINATREKRASYPQVYTTLDRLEESGFLDSRKGNSVIDGARRVTVYSLTNKAHQALLSTA